MSKNRRSENKGQHISDPQQSRRHLNRIGTLFRDDDQCFRGIFEQAHIGISQVSPDGRSLYANPALQRFLGYTDREMRGRPFTGWVHPDDTALSYELVKQFFSGENDHAAVEKRYIRKDAEIVWGRTSVSMVPDDKGGVGSFIVMVEDISERKKMEEKLVSRERQHRTLSESLQHETILESLGEAVLVVDSQKRTILSCNKATENLTGYSRSEMVGKNTEFFHVDRQMYEAFGDQIKSAMASKDMLKLEWQHRRKDGRIVLLEHTIRTVWNEIDGCSMEIDVLRDVTEEKETMHRLKHQNMELKEKTDRLEEMNTDLKVLLDEREAERKRTEENFSSRINNQILPLLERIRTSDLSGPQVEQFDILSASLMETVRPYRRGVAEKMIRMSPREMVVVNQIRQGRSSKEIASQLNLSVRTVEFHRDNIRKKLGIKSRKVNLQTFLSKSII